VVAHGFSLVGRGQKVSHNIDALLLNSEGGNFGEGSWFNQPHSANKWFSTTPLLKLDFGTSGYGSAFSRQNFDYHLKFSRISYLQQRRSSSNHTRVFFKHSKDSAGRGCTYLTSNTCAIGSA